MAKSKASRNKDTVLTWPVGSQLRHKSTGAVAILGVYDRQRFWVMHPAAGERFQLDATQILMRYEREAING